METLTLIFFFATMGIFILSAAYKRSLATVSLMFVMAGATLALTLSDPTLDPATDNTTYMILLIIESLFILWGITWALNPESSGKRRRRCPGASRSGT